jgi:hypothetical protein
MTGGDYDRWDLEIRGGLFGGARLLMATEDHGSGRQMVRFRIAPKWSRTALMPTALFAVVSLGAAGDGAYPVSLLSAVFSVAIVARVLADSGFAAGSVSDALQQLGQS